MYLVLSGEGNSDIGHCNNSQGCCEATEFNPRAMALIIDQIIDKWFINNRKHSLSCLSTYQVTYISEKYLADISLPQKKKMSFAGKKKPKETKYFYENARSLAIFAKNKQAEFSGDDKRKVVAILFRDADGTASSGRGEYDYKRSSMNSGFKAEEFDYGVAMMPKPKSEAWLLCAIKHRPYQNCDVLESASGNDNSPNSLKSQLSNALGTYLSGDRDTIEELINNNKIDIDKINMPSFLEFKSELEKILSTIQLIQHWTFKL